MTQMLLGAIMLFAGLAAVYVSVPAPGEPSRVGDAAAPFVAMLCTAAIFGGALVILSAMLF
jgi:hypothetical protein